ncbi:transcriptional regulator GlxA family with amidase domain [Dokdonella fugitiva]|uniref:Transcriptional regulator GlxA family with amidase domain n=1 Tax=Dokdonella fugitiva TaxID=328517 RepID=A0A839F898_9GAMM|nr:GlxA family transcriptional regulator [Dokdonella fugitiva]MBA8889300.1 transcriptional regulator GlxA family with amidase domain [Dokdonella fugitiva]
MATVGVLVYDDVQSLDVTGPMDVFAAANARASGRAPVYALCTIGRDATPVRTEGRVTIVPDTTLAHAPELDTLVIPGGAGSRVVNADPVLLDWIRERAASARRVVSVCTGLYILAATGLVDGRRVTTHWAHAADAQARYPGVRIEADHLFLRDGRFHTSGGLTAGLDLALSLVEEDHGAAVALAVARELVMYMKRPGNQAQFSAPLDAQTRGSGRLRALVDWLLDHLDEDLGVERLADRMAMSPRHFSRLFADTFDATPARYVERLRLERACVLLTSGTLAIDRVAATVGFASADAFRRAFRVRYGASPNEYRERFGR